MNAKLNQAIKRVLSDPYESLSKGNTMAEDTQKRIDDAQKKVDEANQKVADSRPGNVVSQVSAFGTPSTYEDAQHPAGKAIAQLDEERTQDLDKFNDDSESLAKAAEAAADEQVKAAEASVANAESEADSSEQQLAVQEQREAAAEKKRQSFNK